MWRRSFAQLAAVMRCRRGCGDLPLPVSSRSLSLSGDSRRNFGPGARAAVSGSTYGPIQDEGYGGR